MTTHHMVYAGNGPLHRVNQILIFMCIHSTVDPSISYKLKNSSVFPITLCFVPLNILLIHYFMASIILSRASKAGCPMNHLGS